jgi:hypothetical protein
VTTDVLAEDDAELPGTATIRVASALATMSETYTHYLRETTQPGSGFANAAPAVVTDLDGKPLPEAFEERLRLSVLELPRPDWFGEFLVHYRDHWLPASGTTVPAAAVCPCDGTYRLGPRVHQVRRSGRGLSSSYPISAAERATLQDLGFEWGQSRAVRRTAAITDEIIRMYVDGEMGLAAIARAKGWSTSFVRDALVKTGTPLRPKGKQRADAATPALAEELRRRYEAGATLQELATAEGHSIEFIRVRLLEAGTTMRAGGSRKYLVSPHDG